LDLQDAIVRPADNPPRALVRRRQQALGLTSAGLDALASGRLCGQHTVECGVDPLDVGIGRPFAHPAPRSARPKGLAPGQAA
jgi:hypothetical protein